MKPINNTKPLVLVNKLSTKKHFPNNRYSNIDNNENKNNENILKNKYNQQEFQTNNKTLKKINQRLTVDSSLNLLNKEASKNNELLHHYRCPTTVSTNFSSIKNKHNKNISISNNKQLKKNSLLNINFNNQLSIYETKLKNILKMNNNNLERTRSGRKENTQKSTSSSMLPSTAEKNKKININLNDKIFQDILKTSKFNIEPKINTNNNTNNNSNNNGNNIIRSMNDIKKECLATMRVSEKVQSRILNEGNKIINNIEEKYFLLNKNNKSNSLGLSLQENINNINLCFFSTNFINAEENKKFTKNNFTEEEYKQLLDTFNMIEYGSSILEEYFNEQENYKNALEKHTITPEMRLKMVDWMIEIFTIIQTNEITFFNTVNIMDNFFYKSRDSYKPTDLHLIGICSIFIASKFCDINPIRLNFLVEKIGHGKFSKEEIINMEEKILNVLQYDLLKPTIYEFSTFFFEDLFFLYENNFNIKNTTLKKYLKEYIENNSSFIDLSLKKFNFDKCETIMKYTNNLRNFMKSVLIYLLKMCCQDYEIMNEKKPLISAACIIVAMKICEEVNKDKYIDDIFIERLQYLSRENMINIMEISSKILFRAQNYDKFYPGVKHLYSTHFENLTKMNNTK